MIALSIRQHNPERDGTLQIEEVHPNFVEVYFVPPEPSLRLAGLDPKKAKDYMTKLIGIDVQYKPESVFA